MKAESEAVFFPYQQRWMADTSEVKLCEKSRRVGITWAEAASAVLLAAGENGMDVFYISYNFEFTKEFIQTCAVWAKHFNQAAGEVEEIVIKDEDEDITAYRIMFPSGYKILGLPSRPTTLRGRQGLVIIDEAAFCPDLAELIKAAMALLMWGGAVHIISTHNGEDNPFCELVKDTRAGKTGYSLHRITITDGLEQGLYRRICQRKKEDWTLKKEKSWLEKLVQSYGEGAAEELYCIPSKGGSKYLSRALVESCMSKDIPVLKYECSDRFTFADEQVRIKETNDWIQDNLAPIITDSPDLVSWIGEDFGRSGDLSVVSVQQETTSEGATKALCYVELRNVPFAQQYQIMCYILDHLQRWYGASLDARGNGQMIAELLAQRYGEDVIHRVMITRQFYLDYGPKYKARFEDQQIEIPYSLDILDDHRLVTLDKGIPVIPDTRTSEGNKGLKKRHGDSVVAGMMIEHARANDTGGGQDYDYEAVPVHNDWMTWEERDADRKV